MQGVCNMDTDFNVFKNTPALTMCKIMYHLPENRRYGCTDNEDAINVPSESFPWIVKQPNKPF